MIQFLNVSKVFRSGSKALVDVSLQIEKGEFVFLVGPSGAGKSTFTKLIYKEEEPTRGNILFQGKNLSRMKRSEVPHLRRSIGMVFQDFKLLADKTVYENVAFALQVIEASSKDVKKAVPAALARVGLSQKANSFPSQLSGGEQQRVGIARAIVNNPPVIIADEPTGNLDPDTSWEIMDLLTEIHKCGTTIIMATHARDIVDRLKKRVIAMESGQIIRDEQEGAYTQ